MYQIKWFNIVAEIPFELWEACYPAPFEGYWWYQALEQAGLTDQFTFTYAVVYDLERAVAIAPVFVMNVPIHLVVPSALLPIINLLGKVFPSLLCQRTFFIGSPCADEGRVGMLKGVDVPAVLHAINQATQNQANQFNAPMRVWKDFSNQYQSDFLKSIKLSGLFSLVSFPGTQVKLEGESVEGYLGSLKASRRNKLKKKLKLATLAPVEVEILQQPDNQTMNEIFRLFWQTYEKGEIKFERLNRHFFDLISKNATSYFIILRDKNTNKILSFMLCFKLGEHVINKFIGIDYSQPKEWFLYFRLWMAAVEWSYSVGAKLIQSGQTGYAPKIELGHEMVALTNYCQHKNPIVHWIFARVAKSINWNTLDKDLKVYVRAYPELKPKNNG